MGGLCEDYVFLLQGSLSTCSRELPPRVYMCVFVYAYRTAERTSTCSVSLKCHSYCLSSQTCLFARLALCIPKSSLTSFRHPSSMLFPQNVQCRCAACVLSKATSLSQVQTKLNWRWITGQLRSFSIQESRQLLNLSDSLSFLTT